ncbi:hypothetical protein [Henriciella sp.]|uniref:hypothetical protein n=1 Tax=Henriciella sp. TaxID=1968823 RepID=UPI00261B8E88|nr:hypothetical protein [Henriciella sp.]
MELIHRGFDKLEVSFKAGLPTKVASKFEHAKNSAAQTEVPALLEINGIKFNVAASGMLGGYAYRGNTGQYGEDWWFKKKTTQKDAWGIRVRVSSIRIALRGWNETKQRLIATLEALGITVQWHEVSIARVDFAMDFLAPQFEPVSANFVMGHRFKRNQHAITTEWLEAGRTDRVETITVGKMPGRQLQIYDKRAEVMAKRDQIWFEVFNWKREKEGKPKIDFSVADQSRIWRIELRAGKKHLKDDWKLATWAQVEGTAQRMFRGMLRDVRYVVPSSTDHNRSRWPLHPIWNAAHDALKGDLFGLTTDIPEEHIQEIELAHWEDMIRAQIAGSVISMGARRNISPENFDDFAARQLAGVLDAYSENKSETKKKLAKAGRKYGLLSKGEPEHV